MTYASPAPRCPECGAAYRLGGSRCWLCGGRLPHDGSQNEPPRSLPASHYDELVEATLVTQETAATFSLSSLFLVLTLAAVAAGTFAAAPGLGVLLLVVATPALVRTMVVSSRWKRLGVPVTPSEKVFTFLRSTGVILLIVVCLTVLIVVCIVVASVIAILLICGNALR